MVVDFAENQGVLGREFLLFGGLVVHKDEIFNRGLLDPPSEVEGVRF